MHIIKTEKMSKSFGELFFTKSVYVRVGQMTAALPSVKGEESPGSIGQGAG